LRISAESTSLQTKISLLMLKLRCWLVLGYPITSIADVIGSETHHWHATHNNEWRNQQNFGD